MPVYVHIVRVFGKVSFASTSLRRLSVVAYTELAAALRIVCGGRKFFISVTHWSHLFNFVHISLTGKIIWSAGAASGAANASANAGVLDIITRTF